MASATYSSARCATTTIATASAESITSASSTDAAGIDHQNIAASRLSAIDSPIAREYRRSGKKTFGFISRSLSLAEAHQTISFYSPIRKKPPDRCDQAGVKQGENRLRHDSFASP